MDDCPIDAKMPRISLKQVEEHNGSDDKSSWIVLYGKVYDITSFIKFHPGGNIIQYAAGIADATCLFESYHSTSSIKKCQALLMKYGKYLGDLSIETNSECKYTIDVNDDIYIGKSLDLSNFFFTLRNRVDVYLQQYSGGRHAFQWINQVEAMLTLMAYCIATYYKSFKYSYLAAICLGVIMARMGFLMHSGNHCAISSNSYWNRFVGLFMDIIGSSHYTWTYEHQIAHHITPNEYQKDNDCEIGDPLFRFHPLIANVEQTNNDSIKEKSSRFRIFMRQYQHILVPVFMSVGFFKWTINDIEFLIKSKGGNVRLATKLILIILTMLSKVLWFTTHLIVPYVYFGAKYTFTTLFIFMAIGAYYLENIFIVNHIQEKLQMPVINLDNQSSLHWAIHQVYTTANWKSGSYMATFLSGGLNHQIEHHLFPSMNIYLYPKIAHIVREECNKFGLPYHNYTSFTTAWINMFYYLRKLGNPNTNLDHIQ
jgi:fatty acid desaturase